MRCCGLPSAWRCAVCVAAVWLVAVTAWSDEGQQPNRLEERIAQLIDQLGDEQFATREKAQAELGRLGLAAYDAIHEAQEHEDIEIALRARYLMRSMRVVWSDESDAPEVQKVLRDYGMRSETDRRNRMERLAKLEAGVGTAALCRLVRFETDKRLSKRAALLVMNQPHAEDEASRLQRANIIRQTVSPSKRAAASWLKAYAATLDDPEASLNPWRQLVQDERQTYALFPERTSAELLRDLLRWQAILYRRRNRDEEARAVIRDSLELMDGTREQLLETVGWLLKNEIWSIVGEIAERFPSKFEEFVSLRYRLAEAQLKGGDKELAEQTAKQALALNPQHHEEHIEAAVSLQERGMFVWSEREYRRLIQINPPGSVHNLRARFILSEMLHDIQQDLAAAEVLQGAVDVMEKDKVVLMRVSQAPLNRDPGSIRSRMHYFYSLHYAQSNDRKKQLAQLSEGVKHDPSDADLLIAMYRVDNPDEDFRAATLKRIQEASSQSLSRIKQLRQYVKQAPSESQRYNINRALAYMDNQYAWLVGNTVGDYDEALRCSHESLELVPEEAGYLDTLGRCYYAKKDFVNAVKYQARAVELMPHSGQIRRQLELFQQALAQSQATPAAADGDRR